MPSIKYKKKTYAGATFPVLEMTKAEYDALPEAKKMDGTVYMITDDDGGWEAENASYDNTESGLTATNVQDALDEVKSDIPIIKHGINQYSGLKQGGYSGRKTVQVVFDNPMPNNTYYAHAELNDAWADFTAITCYVFSKSTTGMEVILVNNASGSGETGGTFKWVAIS